MYSAARGAVRNAQQNARFNKSAQQKRPCRPKTAKRIFGGPGSHGPSGQAKERTRVLPVRRGFSAPGVPRHVAGWLFLRGQPLLCGLLCPVPQHFFCRCFAVLFLACGLSAASALGLACAAGACLLEMCPRFLAPHFSFIFCLFLPNFFLSNFFSFVAQAATGLYFLPKRK